LANRLKVKEALMSNIPADLRYTKDDEWIKVDGEEGIVGITDYAQDALSDIVYVELPGEGESLQEGDTFGVVESVKAASDLYMPISGEIVMVNDDLQDTPEILNSDPYGEGWLVRVKLTNAGELDSLMDSAAYSAYCDERG
jgi:glycine cleavage system H protein